MEKVEGKDELVEVEYVTLLTEDGLRRLSLSNVGRIRLINEELDGELRQALAVLAQAHATDKKTVTLNFLGQGRRDVRVGYIQESPVWKTSYRLVLEDDEKPFLQGWAIVENTSDTDWQDVNLSLVSGRPISFIMDLYSPLYATRPVVQPELYSSLRPRTYDQDLNAAAEEFADAARPSESPAAPMVAGAGRGGRGGGRGGGAGGRGGAGGGRGVQGQAALESADGQAMQGELFASDDLAFSEAVRLGVDVAAQGGDVGELFRYEIATPVTLARQRSAMLPIINDSVEGEKLSIYNASVHPKHPLNGLKLKNTSSLHLMQGPITVFDGGVYAGDSKIQDLPPGSERIMSYAMDLDVEVAPTSTGRPQRLASARISKGVMFVSYELSRLQSYVVKNSAERTKKVLIEYPLDVNWTLVAPKEPTEKTRDMYRFALNAEPGKPANLEIEEKRVIQQTVAITNLNEDSVGIYLSAKEISQKVKDALEAVVGKKAEISTLQRERQLIDQKMSAITQEQDRIRQNMNAIGRNNDLYNRYVETLSKQEDQMVEFRSQIRTLEERINQRQTDLDAYLLGLELN